MEIIYSLLIFLGIVKVTEVWRAYQKHQKEVARAKAAEIACIHFDSAYMEGIWNETTALKKVQCISANYSLEENFRVVKEMLQNHLIWSKSLPTLVEGDKIIFTKNSKFVKIIFCSRDDAEWKVKGEHMLTLLVV